MLKAMASTTKPSVHLGNMTFAWSQASAFVNDAIAKQMMDAFVAGSGRNTFHSSSLFHLFLHFSL